MKKLLPGDCLNLLAGEFNLDSQGDIAKFLHVTQPRVSQINNSTNLTKTHIRTFLRRAFQAGKQEGHAEASTKLLGSFGEMQNLDTQVKLASALGKTQGAVAQWKSGYSPISEKTIDSILKKAAHLTIRRVVEMEEVDPGQPGASHWYFYSSKTNAKRAHLLKKLKT
jgi:predicted transcriptional regulator